jgi:poly-beta-1,6-N-acetyl-D-glucosamine synthase
MRLDNIKYVIVTPVRDEERFMEQAIRSVVNQTVRPAEWIIVNDGSTDGTGAIIDQYSREYPWIHVVHRANRGFRKSGGGVVEAFNDGYASLQSRNWDFIVKLDGDLVLDEAYFQHCFEHFQREERLGVGGGTIYYVMEGQEVLEECPRFHVRGATKIYRRQCWEEIGGLWQAPGWDTVDELKAQMLGWKTETFADTKLLHQRMTGTAESVWGDQVKGGLARYVAGYHPLFLLASCASRLIRKPYVTGSLGLLCGYLKGYIKHVPQINDPALIQFVRREQVKRLLGKQTVWNYK